MKSISLIGLGSLNILHALIHLIQFLQSLFIASNSILEDNFLHSIAHNPILGVFWGIFGIISLIIGIKDYKHHNKLHE